MQKVIPLGRNGLYGSVLVDDDELPGYINEMVWDYGIRQKLNDAISDKTDKDGNPLSVTEIKAKAQKVYDQMKAGEWRVRGEAEASDPVEAEAFKLAKPIIIAAFKTVKLWPTKGDDKFQRAVDARRKAMKQEKMDATDYIKAWLVANPKITKLAERNVAERGGMEVGGLV